MAKKGLDLARLTYYRKVRTGIKMPTTRTRKINGKMVEQRYEQDVLQRIYYQFDDFKSFSLDKLGVSIPARNGDITSIDNYFLDFWGNIMGAEATVSYIHLLRYCYGMKDVCFPDLQTIADKMGKTAKTVSGYLDTLENHGFIFRFWAQDPNNDNKDVGIFYKVRRTIPLLSHEQITMLPASLRRSHDELIEQTFQGYEIEIAELYNYTREYERLHDQGKPGKLPIPLSPGEVSFYHRLKVESYKARRTQQDIDIWSDVLRYLKGEVAETSYNMWLKDTFCLFEQGTIIVYADSQFIAEWMSNRYAQLISKALKDTGHPFDNIEFKAITLDFQMDLELK